MQEVHPAGATSSAAGGGFTDRRQAHNHPTAASAAALKCPRCDSLNTKFCYYNNYNLSQPRHFCKNCRRYWTNGGVLRNVPVGGGSRKSSKRPIPKSKPKSKPKPKPKISISTTACAAERNAVVLNHEPPKLDEVFLAPDLNPDPNPKLEALGFSRPSADATASFGEILPTEEWEVMSTAPAEEKKAEGLAGAVVDQTVRIEDLVESRGGDHGGVVALDWQGNDPNGFGLGLIDDQSYWSQAATTSFDDHHLPQQWFDHHHHHSSSDNLHLFLP